MEANALKRQPKPPKSVQAWVRISEADKKRLDRVADQAGLNPSQYLRVVLKQALDNVITLNPKKSV